ncbi:MFS transporter [Evansella sp. AB-rgal1]|uniref:MFS transporter n=1 Tax=Evansella sp. AB-rgal1 TaxID=3242696 RepID=UPI00359DC6CD
MVRISTFYFTLFFSFAVVIMFFPLYLQHLGLSTSQVGIIVAMGSVVSVIGQPIWGYISDKLHSIKKVLLIVMMGSLIMSFFLYSVNTFFTILIIFTCFMFFMTSCGPLTESIAIRFAAENNKNYGVMRSFGAIGTGTSSLVLGTLLGVIGIHYLGWMYASIMMIAIPLVFLLQDPIQVESKEPITISSVKKLMGNKKYIWMLFISFLLLITHKMNDSLFSIYLSELGAREAEIGRAWMVATFSSVPAFALTGYLIKRCPEIILISMAGFLYALRWFLYGYWDEPVVLIYLQMMQGVTFPILFVSAFSYVTKLIPKELLGTGQLLFIASTMGLGGLFGSAGGGWYMEHFSPQATYYLGSFITLGGAMLATATIFIVQRKSKREKSKIQE